MRKYLVPSFLALTLFGLLLTPAMAQETGRKDFDSVVVKYIAYCQDRLQVLGNALFEGTGKTLTVKATAADETSGNVSKLRVTGSADALRFSVDEDGDITAPTIAPAIGTGLTIGDPNTTTVTVTTDGGSVSIDGAVNGVAPAGVTADLDVASWTFTKTTAGVVTLTSADDDATAALTVDPGGNATLTLGSASDTISAAATSGITLSNSETLSNGTNGTLTLGRNDTGVVTLTAKDDDATAALTILPGGAAAMVLGGGSMTSLTVTADGTGTAEVALPAGSIDSTEVLNGTLLPADQAAPGRGSFTVCGDATTVNNNTIYYGPDQAVVSSATVGLGRKCDTTAAGNATEATADALAFNAMAFQILSMDCTHADANAALTFAARSAEGATTPSVTCTDADNDTDCVANVQTTTAIASGATFAVAVSSTADVGTVPFVCRVEVAF